MRRYFLPELLMLSLLAGYASSSGSGGNALMLEELPPQRF